jgi:hypothetical protein
MLTRPQESNHFNPPVRSTVLRQYGELKGVRLIDFASLKAYLSGLPDGDRKNPRAAKGAAK